MTTLALQSLLTGKRCLKNTTEVSEWPSDFSLHSGYIRCPRQRPRTSPIRSFDGKCVRSRSPSSPVLVSRHTDNAILQQQNFLSGAGEAFYSTKPPPAPVRIMFIDPPSQYDPTRIQRLQKTMKQIETIRVSDGNVYMNRILGSSIAQQPLRISPPFYCHTFRVDKKSSSAIRLVHFLLCDLLSSLPLTDNCNLLQATISNVEQPMVMHDARNSSDRKSYCSIAIQAQQDAKSLTVVTNGSERSSHVQTEEWAGGVRALRDSHVRLVLRQLRHIERLNRALDRVAKLNQ